MTFLQFAVRFAALIALTLAILGSVGMKASGTAHEQIGISQTR